MKERSFDPRALDLQALCKADAMLRGEWPLAGMERLSSSFCAATDGPVTWQGHGRLVPVKAGESELWLDLQASAEVPLECQRCLQPMRGRLQIERHFRFVRHEDEAARLDEESEDDVLVLAPRLDLHELLEDELILALPIVPRHGVCPAPLPMSAADDFGEEAATPSPFAALAALRGRPTGGG